MKVNDVIRKLIELQGKHGNVQVEVLAVDDTAQESASGLVGDVYFSNGAITIDNMKPEADL